MYAFGEDDEIPNYYYAGEISSQLQSDLFIFSILGSLIQVFSVPTSLLYILPLTIFEGVMLQSKHLLFWQPNLEYIYNLLVYLFHYF